MGPNHQVVSFCWFPGTPSTINPFASSHGATSGCPACCRWQRSRSSSRPRRSCYCRGNSRSSAKTAPQGEDGKGLARGLKDGGLKSVVCGCEKKQKVRKWMKEKTEVPGLKFLRFKVVMGLFNFCLYLGVADIWARVDVLEIITQNCWLKVFLQKEGLETYKALPETEMKGQCLRICTLVISCVFRIKR